MRKKMIIPYLDGKYMIVHQKGERFAMEEINKRIEYYLPIETVDVEEVRKIVNYIRVNVSRDCTAQEVNGLVESIKNLLRDALDHMPKHERYLYDKRGEVNDKT